MKSTKDLVYEMLEKQNEIIGTILVAPMISDSKIAVKVGGYNHFLNVANRFDHHGHFIGFFRVENIFTASFVRPCNVHEQNRYLSIFPRKHIVVTDPENMTGIEFGTIKHVKYFSYERRDIFQVIACRLIGNFLMDCGISNVDNPAVSALMRKNLLEKKREMDKYPGVSGFHKVIYLEIARSNEETDAEKIQHALEYNGAGLVDYKYNGDDRYIVRYTVGGREFIAEISQNNLQVISSGVCLSGEDGNYDLTSVIGVIRHGLETDQINIV